MEDPEKLISEVRGLRARGMTPKAIAKALGITRAEADAAIRRIAREAAMGEASLVGCWVNAGWSQGLSWSAHPEWHDEYDNGKDIPDLVNVLVVREHRYDKVTVCAYLVDAQCLGIKDALGPRVIERSELEAFIARQYMAYDRPPLRAPLALAQELVFGAEAYARTLGFEPHRDLAACRGHLGTWQGPSAIVFGYHGEPCFIQGPNDDVDAVAETLEKWAGAGREGSVAVEPRGAIEATGPDEQAPRGPARIRSLARGAAEAGATEAGAAEAGAAEGFYQVLPVAFEIPGVQGPADALRGTPTRRLSDSLLRVMKPYLPWPPAQDKIDELGEELSFGATVWNATAQSTDASKTAALLEAVVGMFSTEDAREESALRAQVAEIAERKRRMCPDDPRLIASVAVVPRGRDIEVLAVSAPYFPDPADHDAP